MKTIAVLQARCSSSRLPQKVLRKIKDKELILHEIERIKKSKMINEIILATSTEDSDTPLAELCHQHSIKCHRGDLNDVLKRFYTAVENEDCSTVVRLTGDCPLIDPYVIDLVIDDHLNNDSDYTTNAIEATYPDGLDCEVFSKEALKQAFENAQLKSEREHVTPYIYNNPDKFKITHFKGSKDLSFHRWTVDEPKDLELIEKIYELLYKGEHNFFLEEILNLFDKNESLFNINSKFERNEGYAKSLKED